jgi:Na+/H+ antiporter NhaC
MKTTQHGKKSNAIRSLALCLVLLTILVQAATASEVALPGNPMPICKPTGAKRRKRTAIGGP